jgi:hypothetical protein
LEQADADGNGLLEAGELAIAIDQRELTPKDDTQLGGGGE